MVSKQFIVHNTYIYVRTHVFCGCIILIMVYFNLQGQATEEIVITFIHSCRLCLLEVRTANASGKYTSKLMHISM